MPTDTIAAELVIFDCDGVLVDTEPIAARVTVAVLASMGWEMDEQEALDRFLGCTPEYFRAQVESRLGRRLHDGWDAQFDQLYETAFATELRAVDGIPEVLDALDELGVTTCVASNGGHDKMLATLGATGLYDRFAGRIFSAQDVVHGKPAPDLYLHAAQAMGVAPDRCVVVEDSPRGVASATAAGMPCLAFAAVTRPELLAGQPGDGVTVCRSMPEVLDRLRRMLPDPT